MGKTGASMHILIGEESTKGTAVTPEKDIGLVQDINIGTAKTGTEIQTIGSTDTQSVLVGKKEHTANISVIYQNGRLFYLVMGDVAHDTTDTPDVKHTYTVSDDLPFVTLEAGIETSTEFGTKLTSAHINSLKMSIDSIDAPLTLSADFIAMASEKETTIGTKVIGDINTLSGADSTVTIDSTEVDEVQKAEVSFDRGATQSYGLGARDPQSIEATKNSVKFTATVGIKDEGLLDAGISTDKVPIVWDIDNGITAGEGKRQVYFKMTGSNLNTKVVGSISDITYYEIEATGILDTLYSYDTYTTDDF